MIIALLGVAVGFIFAAAWDVWKADKALQDELERASRSVAQEIEANRKVIDGNLAILAADDKAASSDQEIATPFVELVVTGAGDAAFLRGSFDAASAEVTERLRNAYVAAAIVNRRIDSREIYRATNGAMSNYHKRRVMLNAQLQSDLEDLRRRFDGLLGDINKLN